MWLLRDVDVVGDVVEGVGVVVEVSMCLFISVVVVRTAHRPARPLSMCQVRSERRRRRRWAWSTCLGTTSSSVASCD